MHPKFPTSRAVSAMAHSQTYCCETVGAVWLKFSIICYDRSGWVLGDPIPFKPNTTDSVKAVHILAGIPIEYLRDAYPEAENLPQCIYLLGWKKGHVVDKGEWLDRVIHIQPLYTE